MRERVRERERRTLEDGEIHGGGDASCRRKAEWRLVGERERVRLREIVLKTRVKKKESRVFILP